MAAGIDIRHRQGCTARRDDAKCPCGPGFQAHVFDARTGKRIRKTFASRSEAKSWRIDALKAVKDGTLDDDTDVRTLSEAFEEWWRDADRGVVTTRGGDRYKPATLISYKQAYGVHVRDRIGPKRFCVVSRADIQHVVDELLAEEMPAATIQTAITPLRAVYRDALTRDRIKVMPTVGVKMPTVRSRRDRIAAPAEAAKLLAAIPDADRALWATALYAGLRRGELLGLRWSDVDLEAGTIEVARSWDPRQSFQETKNRQRRRVPIPTALREHLAAQRLRQPPGLELVFATEAGPAAVPDRHHGARR